MGRVRKNYILFKNEGKEPTLAGSFSSMRRAREAIKEDAGKEVKDYERDSDYVPNIEMRPDGGRLNLESSLKIDYSIHVVKEDCLVGRNESSLD